MIAALDPPRRYRVFDLHLPVFAYERLPDGSLETPRPVIYGTAFPVAPGLFATAGHVVRDAGEDGQIGLSYLSAAGETIKHYEVPECAIVEEIDLGLIKCPTLAHLAPIPLDFDRPLPLLAPVSAIGFPVALDAEYVTCIPRAFAGHVVSRRELYHVPAQPVGYEVSFFAPKGLSGAPLISNHFGAPFCYGYVIQQSTLGLGNETTPVGIAVGIDMLLATEGKVGDESLPQLLGRPVKPHRASPRPIGWQGADLNDLEFGWPEEE